MEKGTGGLSAMIPKVAASLAMLAAAHAFERFAGLAPCNLNEGRDLPVLHDFRAVIAQPLARVFNLPERRLADLFPGATWDRSLDGLVRRT